MLNFTPIDTSPDTTYTHRSNFTGKPRVVRDLAAEIHANVQQWNDVHLHGLSLLKSITQLKIDETYSEELADLCDDLMKDCEKLDDVVEKLSQATRKLNAVKLMYKGSRKLFSTWPVERFEETAAFIYEAYKNEAAVKRKILENVAHDHRESAKMLHLAAWAYQTQIPDRAGTALESLLVETWHRS